MNLIEMKIEFGLLKLFKYQIQNIMHIKSIFKIEWILKRIPEFMKQLDLWQLMKSIEKHSFWSGESVVTNEKSE